MSLTHINLTPADIQAIASDFGFSTVSAQQKTGKVFRMDTRQGSFALRFFNTDVERLFVEATQQVRWKLAATGLAVGPALCAIGGNTIISYNHHYLKLSIWQYYWWISLKSFLRVPNGAFICQALKVACSVCCCYHSACWV